MEEQYTIRILYRSEENPSKLVGLVERRGAEERRGFVGMEGLWRIVACIRGTERRMDGSSRGSRHCRQTVAELFPELGEE